MPLFKEQTMNITIVASGFLPYEADQLRCAVATFKYTGTIDYYRDRMINSMIYCGYERDLAERYFKQINGLVNTVFNNHSTACSRQIYVSC